MRIKYQQGRPLITTHTSPPCIIILIMLSYGVNEAFDFQQGRPLITTHTSPPCIIILIMLSYGVNEAFDFMIEES
jgi:hypothetical protein